MASDLPFGISQMNTCFFFHSRSFNEDCCQ